MKFQKRYILGLIIPVLLAGFAISLDYQSLQESVFPFQKQQFQEVLLILALGLFIWGFTRWSWLRR